MTTLVGLRAVKLLLFHSSGFSSRQPPPGAGYNFWDRVVCLWQSRDQVQDGGFVVAQVGSVVEFRSWSAGSTWPRSGGALWLQLGRGQVVVCGFCLAKVMSSSAASPASCVAYTVSSWCGPAGSRPGVFFVLQVPFFWGEGGGEGVLAAVAQDSLFHMFRFAC